MFQPQGLSVPHLDFDVLVTMTHGLLTLTGTTEQGMAYLRTRSEGERIDGLSLVFRDIAEVDIVFAVLDALGLRTLTL